MAESSEAMIYPVLGQYPSEKFTIEELFAVGKKRLISLAYEELNSITMERYFRFAAWHVRRTIVGKENEYPEKKSANSTTIF